MNAVDYVKNTQGAIQELKDRLSQLNDKTAWGQNSNYGLTEEECIAKFFKDQGLSFAPYDVEDVKALLTESSTEPEAE